MKTLQDIRRAAWLEVTHAQARASFQHEAYYLWFHPTVPGRDGAIMAAKDRPGNGGMENASYELVTPERIPRGETAESFVNRNIDILGRLPVLSITQSQNVFDVV